MFSHDLGRYDPFAEPPVNGRYFSLPAEDENRREVDIADRGR